MISRSTAAASWAEKSCREATRSMADVTTALAKEVAQDLHAVGRQDRLGVELNALRRQLAMTQAHHDTAAGGADLEHVRYVRVHDERVIAGDLDLLGQPGV